MGKYRSTDVIKVLSNKGFKGRGGSHVIMHFYDENNRKTKISTGLSKGSHGIDLEESMLRKMAKECFMEYDDFILVLDCPHDYNWILNNYKTELERRKKMNIQNPRRTQF